MNDAAVRLQWSTALFSIDHNWIRNRMDFLAVYKGEIYLAVADEHVGEVPGATYLTRRKVYGLSDDPTTVHISSNSGYGALNVAYLKGARRIVLLGYDFCNEKGVSHWFETYAWRPKANDGYFKGWALDFVDAAKQLKAAGVQVLNASPISKVAAFPFVDLERCHEL